MYRASRPHILMLLENHPYPQDSRVRQEAQALVAEGYTVSVISPAGSGQSWCETVHGVRVYRFPMPPGANGLLGYVLEYGCAMTAALLISLWVFLRHGFDVIHAHNPPDTFVFIAALYKLFGRRFVFDHHDLSPEMYDARFPGEGKPLLRKLLFACERLSYRLADHTIATNESYKALAVQRHQIPVARITVVRNGPALNRLQPTAPISELRQKAPIIIGYAGTMGVQDGVDYLFRALSHLVTTLGRRDFFCVLVGNGDALTELQSLAAQLQLTEYVHFTGWVEPGEVPRYLSTADICVAPEPSNPYNDRSTMIKIMEYMAMAKPIVAFDLPEHRASAQDAAIYVPGNDELAFARALAHLMDDPARCHQLGTAGHNRVENALAWKHSIPPLLAVYGALFPRLEVSSPATPVVVREN
ncbi:MAG: glycosyltransferase family 4 protein [Deltaproteobacteria bacterium]|nr:glycosyltransferase family 4 protein [Deltaproteobacteria bacterium]